MTLIIAGHEMQVKDFNQDQSQTFQSDLFTAGRLYFATDSVISRDGELLVRDFKKVINIPIRIREPYFIEEYFHSYIGEEFNYNCVIAFAGSTLVAQHYINSITNHLSDLCPIYFEGKYQLAMPCESRKLLKQNGWYDENMFLTRHIENLLSATFVSEVMKHSIEASLKRARDINQLYRLFHEYACEFILGFYCPIDHNHHLYIYELVPDQEHGVKVLYKEVPFNEFAFIGMGINSREDIREQFNQQLKERISTSQNNEKISEIVYDYLNDKIKELNSKNDFKIGKPSALFSLYGNRLTKAHMTD